MVTSTQSQSRSKAAPDASRASLQARLLQRKCACGNHTIAGGACAACEQKHLSLQRASQNSELGSRNSGDVSPIVNEVLSSGQPLDATTRAFFEPRFGHDFSRVRVHTDARAAESARAVNALAYTLGSNIVLASGQYSPTTLAGKKLLAHELTHVLQQSGIDSLGVQRQVAVSDNAKPNQTPQTEATPADAPVAHPVSDAEIEALDLAATAKAGAQALKKKHPGISFTSGRRNVAKQAHAMASNIVSGKDRKWIEKTYASAAALQKWVDDHPKATTVDQISKGLEDTMNGLSAADLGKVSKHLSGEAFDVQPQEEDAAAIKKDIKALSGLTKFLEKEGGLVRWHAQFKLAGSVARADDPLEQQADLIAEQICRDSDLNPYSTPNSLADGETTTRLDTKVRVAPTLSFSATNSGALQRQTRHAPARPHHPPSSTTPTLGHCRPVQDDLRPTAPWAALQRGYQARCSRAAGDVGGQVGSAVSDILNLRMPRAPHLPDARSSVDCACAYGTPSQAALAAMPVLIAAGSLARQLYQHFLEGSGTPMPIDVAGMIARSAGVR